jgi:putative endonuclease
MKSYYVYILNNPGGMLYIGVTNNLIRRVYEHRQELVDGYTKRYHIHRLLYFEETSDVNVAIAREKEIKSWRRRKKLALVYAMNPTMQDLAAEWYDDNMSPRTLSRSETREE